MTFGFRPCGQAQRTLWGGRWWLPPSPGHGEYCESVFARGSSVHQKCSNYALTNLLFDLCRSVWIIDPFVTCHNPHPKAPTRPTTPEMLWVKEHTSTFYPSIVFILDSQLSPSRSLGVCHAWLVQIVEWLCMSILSCSSYSTLSIPKNACTLITKVMMGKFVTTFIFLWYGYVPSRLISWPRKVNLNFGNSHFLGLNWRLISINLIKTY
jgi:hypothetical protein